MKNKIKIALLAISIITSALLTGCSGDEEIPTTLSINKKSEYNYLNGLEAGKYYVLHKDKTYEEAYFGEATFEKGETTSSPMENSRIMWFKEDFEKVPTLYKGDLLIYYNPEKISEKNNFERFYPYGYTVGLCGLQVTDSGRMSISTNKDDKNTYPYSDADEIINLHNETVIIDTMSDQNLRQVYKNNEQNNEIDWENSNISKIGTINGLIKDKHYKFEIYDGTIKKEFKLKADVFALGSYEVYENYQYNFICDHVLNVPLPEWFNNGYYMINGEGMFRYVNGTSYDEKTDFISHNEKPELDEGNFSSSIIEKNNTTAPTEESEEGENNIKSSFSVEQGGWLNIVVNFENTSSDDKRVTALLRTPQGSYYELDNNADGSVSIELNAKETGNYVIEYYDLGNRIPNLNITTKKKNEIDDEEAIDEIPSDEIDEGQDILEEESEIESD